MTDFHRIRTAADYLNMSFVELEERPDALYLIARASACIEAENLAQEIRAEADKIRNGKAKK